MSVELSSNVLTCCMQLKSCTVMECGTVTGQLTDMPSGLPTRRLVSSRTGQVTDWTAHGLVKSRSAHLADRSTRGCCHQQQYLAVNVSVGILQIITHLLHKFWLLLVNQHKWCWFLLAALSASWLICELSSPWLDLTGLRAVQSATCPVRELASQ